MHLISTSTLPFQKKCKNNYEILQLLKSVGFEAYDFTMCGFFDNDNFILIKSKDYIQKAKQLREYADKIGITCNQAHSIFPSINPNDKNDNVNRIRLTKRSIKVASILGAKIIIIHPYNNYSGKENSVWLIPLGEYAKKHHIKIAIENMWNIDPINNRIIEAACSTIDDYKDHLSHLDKEVFVACVDVGHASMMGKLTNPYDMIKALSNDVEALHLHSNDLRNDSHEIPFSMDVDFVKIVEALKEINYQGDFTLECEKYVFSRENENIYELAKNMKEAVTKIRTMFDCL